MATTITVLHNQSILDIAIQHTGNVYNAFAIAKANGLSITHDLTPGETISIPQDIIRDSEVYNYYKTKSLIPATTVTKIVNSHDEPSNEEAGIGYWAIDYDFIIS